MTPAAAAWRPTRCRSGPSPSVDVATAGRKGLRPAAHRRRHRACRHRRQLRVCPGPGHRRGGVAGRPGRARPREGSPLREHRPVGDHGHAGGRRRRRHRLCGGLPAGRAPPRAVRLDLSTGGVRWHRLIDPPGLSAKVEQERGALTLDRWPGAGALRRPLRRLRQLQGGGRGGRRRRLRRSGRLRRATHREAGIWTPGGPVVDEGGECGWPPATANRTPGSTTATPSSTSTRPSPRRLLSPDQLGRAQPLRHRPRLGTPSPGRRPGVRHRQGGRRFCSTGPASTQGPTLFFRWRTPGRAQEDGVAERGGWTLSAGPVGRGEVVRRRRGRVEVDDGVAVVEPGVRFAVAVATTRRRPRRHRTARRPMPASRWVGTTYGQIAEPSAAPPRPPLVVAAVA